jgi:hypothetical protein
VFSKLHYFNFIPQIVAVVMALYSNYQIVRAIRKDLIEILHTKYDGRRDSDPYSLAFDAMHV